MNDLLQHPIVRGALAGAAGAALGDYRNFRSWKSVDDAMTYEWKTAAWRWFQGAVGGAMAAAGLSAF